MRTYLISYDLEAPLTKKHALAEMIMELGLRWARPLEQTWYVTSDQSGEEIEHSFASLLDDNDGLLVQAVDDEATLSNTALRWFRQRTPTITDDFASDNIVAFQPATTSAPAINSDIEYAEAS